MDPVPWNGPQRVGACTSQRRAAEEGEVEVVRAAAAARRQGHAGETVFSGLGDDCGDGVVEIAVVDRRAGVGSPESAEHPFQRAVVQLGEVVEPRDAAGLPIVVAGRVAG